MLRTPSQKVAHRTPDGSGCMSRDLKNQTRRIEGTIAETPVKRTITPGAYSDARVMCLENYD